ncbi:glycosyltransferase [Lewinella sp. LCG006]|uniref:glycosyltransferase n=1 Tax=Lewinella sp. LCG006 TaxID=3231911 RepID=UPI003460A7B9
MAKFRTIMPGAFQQYTRLPEWWQAKAGNLLGVLYLIIIMEEIPFLTSIYYLGPAILTIIGIGGFGHFINDWLDIDTDLQVGKPNRVGDLSQWQRWALLALLLAVALLPWLFLPQDANSWLLLGAEFTLLTLYALPPVRLKERPWLGVLTDGLYAYALPSVLAAYTFMLVAGAEPNIPLLGVLFSWQLLVGVHNIMIHQIVDCDNDQRTQTRTLATSRSAGYVSRVMTWLIWPLELLVFGLLVVYLSSNWWSSYFVLPLLVLLLKYVSLFQVASLRMFGRSTDEQDHQLLNIHYHQFWPFWHLILAVLWIDPWYLLVLFVHTISLFFNRLLQWSLFWKMGSLTVNYGIYYYRRLVLRQDIQTARREYYEDYIDRKTRKDRLKKQACQQADTSQALTIALCNRNQNKYTETFVRQHLQHLPFHVVPVYGHDDYFPIKTAKGKLLYTTNAEDGKLWWNRQVLGLGEQALKEKALQSYLVKEGVQLILAEFGTVGAHVLPVAKKMDLPLVVVFYGYDAFHAQVLSEFRRKYQEMFAYAAAIIGVSQDICQQLQKLGAQAEKVHYLPCAVNLSLFSYEDHSRNPPVFLSVGRFAETKSPHLTILAFAQVAKEIPEARLVMVGKDGGGELFEACHILVRALGLEDKVDFKGILSPWEVFEEMQKARVFVQHSLTTPLQGDKEGTPVAIMEAMACGLPVVSTRHGGIAEMIQHEETGLLVEEYDVDGMAKAMLRLIREQEFAAQLAQQAAQWIRKNELVTNHHDRLAEIILRNTNQRL